MSNPTRTDISLCIRKGMNYREIADKYQTSPATISRIMKGTEKPLSGADNQIPIVQVEEQRNTKYTGTEAENYYLNKSLKDCEDRIRKLNTELIDTQNEARKYKSSADELQKKLELFEERKSLEIEKILLENERNRKSVIEGLGNLVTNDKGQEILLGALRILGDFTGKKVVPEKLEKQDELSDNPIINAYVKKLVAQMELMESDELGKWVTVAISLSQPSSKNALNTLYEKVQQTQS